MAATADPTTILTVDPALEAAWTAAGGGAVRGIAGAVAGDLGAVVVVTDAPVDDASLSAANRELAGALGVRAVEVVLAAGSTLPELVRDWTYQAGQGSGRGVHVKVRADDGADDDAGADMSTAQTSAAGPVRVLVRAIDSSARELAFRLASPQEPALPALRALLGGREVTVTDEESLPG